MKPVPKPTASLILAGIHAEVKKQKTNPYQIAKGSGLPLTTVQRLLILKINVPLRNVEMLAKALGLKISLVATGKGVVASATGRGHGVKKTKAKKSAPKKAKTKLASKKTTVKVAKPVETKPEVA